MRKELRRVPIHMREVAFCYPDRSDAAPPHLGRLEMDLEPNVEGPLPLVPKIVGGRGLRLGLMAVGQQRLDRDNPRTDLRREGFGGEGTERHALPTLEIARAPVVKERQPEAMLIERFGRNALAEPLSAAKDDADLEFEKSERRRVGKEGGR